jgi:hypothetical protein
MDPSEIEQEMRRTRAAIVEDFEAIAERTRRTKEQTKEQSLRAVPVMLLAMGTLMLTRWWRHRRLR